MSELKHQAKQLALEGQHQQALNYLQQHLQMQAGDADGYLLGARIYAQLNDLPQAEKLAVAALKCQPEWAEPYIVLGNLFMLSNKLAPAAEALQAALKLDEANAAVAEDLVAVLLMQNNAPKAAQIGSALLAKLPSNASLTANTAMAFYRQGAFEQALPLAEKACALASTESDFLWNLFKCRLELVPVQAWGDFIFDKRLDKTLKPEHLAGVLVRRLVYAWLNGDAKTARHSFNRLASTAEQMEGIDPATLDPTVRAAFAEGRKNARGYHGFFAHLLDYTPPKVDLPPLHFIGDSHTLPPAGQAVSWAGEAFQVQPHLVMGCKAYHLGQTDPNEYQGAFKCRWAELPQHESVIVSCGEIDARSYEGIFPAAFKKGLAADELAIATARKYVNFLAGLPPKEGKVALCGVPAPAPGVMALVAADQEEVYVNMVCAFNNALREAAHRKGFDFIDLYAMTLDENGVAQTGWHLDDHHLKPEGLAMALQKYVQSA